MAHFDAREQSVPCLLACRLKLFAGSFQHRTKTRASRSTHFHFLRVTEQDQRIIVQLEGNFDNRTRETLEHRARTASRSSGQQAPDASFLYAIFEQIF